MTTPHTPESDRALIERLRDALKNTDHHSMYAAEVAAADARLAASEGIEGVPANLTLGETIYTPPSEEVKFCYSRGQPNNINAWRLGEACSRASLSPGGDFIDTGLSLLKELEVRGYGVFRFVKESTPPAEAALVGEPRELFGICMLVAEAAWKEATGRDRAVAAEPLKQVVLSVLDEQAPTFRAAIATLQQPSRDREEDRQRFPDAGFNRWLDDGISDCGHTVYDATPDLACAWAGWTAREYYGAQPSPSADVRQRARELLVDLRGAASLSRAISHAELDELSMALESAIAQPQQAGGQAVAWLVRSDKLADRVTIYKGEAETLARTRDGATMHPLYLAAPTLPDVSEADVDAAEDAWNDVFDGMPGSNRAALRHVLECDRTSLRATLLGEVKP